MLNITYSFYEDTYGGSSISEENFLFILRRAIGIANGILTLDLYDYNDGNLAESLETRLKIAICAAADIVNSGTDSGSASVSEIVASESVAGAWSKTYKLSDSVTSAGLKLRQDVRCVLEDYLSNTSLILRGYYLHV